MTTYRSSLICCGAALGAALLVWTGCASRGYDKGAATGEAIQQAATRINEGAVQLNKTISSMNALVSSEGQDLRPLYETFSSDVNKLQSLAEDVRDNAKAMQDRGKKFFAAWDQQLAAVQNEDLKSRSAERKEKVANQFQKINESYQQAKDLFRPLMADLKDVQTYLATDLTSGGLKTIKNTAAKANAEVVPVREAVIKLVEQFRTLGLAMSTQGPPASK